ncbi:hypothetical protein CBL_10762 [Carabus blaptoides fortunei]
MVIQGIEEARNEDEDRIKNKVNDVLSKMQINIDLKCDITELRRIGRENKKKLKGTEIYINEDFPKEIQNQRRELIKYMKTARTQGHEVTLLYNKLKINDKIYTLEQFEEDEEVVGEALTDLENESKTNTSKRTIILGGQLLLKLRILTVRDVQKTYELDSIRSQSNPYSPQAGDSRPPFARVDFWKLMNIAPNIQTGKWVFTHAVGGNIVQTRLQTADEVIPTDHSIVATAP